MHVCVSAIGVDRPGVIAALTAVLQARACNLEDTRMTLLRGHFAMVLLVDAPDQVDLDVLGSELADSGSSLGVEVAVRRVDEPVLEHPGDPHVLTVYGGDRPGIVHAVCQALARRQVNVEDLSTRTIGSDEHPVYAMVLDITVPEGTTAEALDHDLGQVAAEMGVDFTLRPTDDDVL